MKVVTNVGTLRDSGIYLIADSLIKLSKTKSPWTVIEAIISAWKKTNPRKWKAHLVQMEETVKTRRNQTASTKTNTLRYLVDFPEPVFKMIRVVYPDLQMDKKFFREFAKRFQEFKVAQKI